MSLTRIQPSCLAAVIAILTAPVAAPATPAQPAAPAAAMSAACKLSIAANDMMQFDKKELRVPASCKQVQLTLRHSGKLPAQAMGHNWVLVKTSDLNAVANAGLAAGLKNHYVAAGDKRVLAATKVIGGGQSASVTFSTVGLAKGGAYSFVCTFPGHSSLMKGKFVIQ